MAGIFDEFFDINAVVSEEAEGFLLCSGEGGFQLGGGIHPADTTAAASGRGFDHNGVADLLRNAAGVRQGRNFSVGSGDDRHAGGFHGGFGHGFISHLLHGGGWGTDEGNTAFFAHPGEGGVFGEKAESGMKSVGAGDLAGG